MPTLAWDIPFMCAGESNEKRTPFFWWLVAPPLENCINDFAQCFAANFAKNGVIFQALKVCWPFHRPCILPVAVNANGGKRLPNSIAHTLGLFSIKRGNTHPTMNPEMLQRSFVKFGKAHHVRFRIIAFAKLTVGFLDIASEVSCLQKRQL
jgi:hypothetical protein